MALQRSGQSTAMMLAVRAPELYATKIAFSMFSASINAMMSRATTDEVLSTLVGEIVLGRES
jgi:hypothetical protein